LARRTEGFANHFFYFKNLYTRATTYTTISVRRESGGFKRINILSFLSPWAAEAAKAKPK